MALPTVYCPSRGQLGALARAPSGASRTPRIRPPSSSVRLPGLSPGL